jgi:hypothetical protein
MSTQSCNHVINFINVINFGKEYICNKNNYCYFSLLISLSTASLSYLVLEEEEENCDEYRVVLFFLISALGGGGWLTRSPGRFTQGKETR